MFLTSEQPPEDHSPLLLTTSLRPGYWESITINTTSLLARSSSKPTRTSRSNRWTSTTSNGKSQRPFSTSSFSAPASWSCPIKPKLSKSPEVRIDLFRKAGKGRQNLLPTDSLLQKEHNDPPYGVHQTHPEIYLHRWLRKGHLPERLRKLHWIPWNENYIQREMHRKLLPQPQQFLHLRGLEKLLMFISYHSLFILLGKAKGL